MKHLNRFLYKRKRRQPNGWKLSFQNRVNKHKLLVFRRESKTMMSVLQTTCFGAGGGRCRLAGLSDSPLRSKPAKEPQTKPDLGLSVTGTVLFRTLTNICLLLPPPSPLRRLLPLVSPPRCLCSRCSWHLLEPPVDL